MKRRLLVAIALFALAVPLAAQSADVRTHTLKNGLRVLTLEDRSIPMISFYVFYRVGARNERPGITGVSHLFEHDVQRVREVQTEAVRPDARDGR